MIPFSAASVEACWEPPLVLPSEQRQVAAREPRWERQLEGQPGYSGGSLLHLHHHRAPITATHFMGTPPTAILPTVIQAMDTQLTHSPATDTQVIRVHQDQRLRQPMSIRATQDTPTTPALRAKFPERLGTAGLPRPRL